MLQRRPAGGYFVSSHDRSAADLHPSWRAATSAVNKALHET